MKTHVLITGEGLPAVDINPIQYARIFPHYKKNPAEEIEAMKEDADPKEQRSLEYRSRMLKSGEGSPFLYRD